MFKTYCQYISQNPEFTTSLIMVIWNIYFWCCVHFLSHWKKEDKGDVKDNATVVDVVSKSIERGEIITWHLFLTKLISHLFPPATRMWLKYKCHYPLVFYNESVMDHKSNFTSALTTGNGKRQYVGPISKHITNILQRC